MVLLAAAGYIRALTPGDILEVAAADICPVGYTKQIWLGGRWPGDDMVGTGQGWEADAVCDG